MKIKVVSVGKIREKFIKEGIQEYTKRLQAYTKVEYVEIPDESIPDSCSFAIQENIKQKEGKKVLQRIKEEEYVIVLDVAGKQIDSIQFSRQIEQCMIAGKSTITFIIGGSLGHGELVLTRANDRISFSKMTFPHQLMKCILMEQIYRAFKIMKNESYHK